MRLPTRHLAAAGAALGLAGALLAGAHPAAAGSDVLHNGRARGLSGPATGQAPLQYHGGVGGIGVETAPRVYIVRWGWTSDPSGERPYQEAFFQGVGGSTWNNSVTQYCQDVAGGATSCPTGSAVAGNPAGVLAGEWDDAVNPLPSRITQTTLAAEAVRAAAHFGNTLASSNASVQYVIDTPHGHSTRGFGTQFCAWHSSTSSSYGNIAYTNFPYQTDAGASCGQNFVNSGSAGTLDGVSIVGGHEFAETETDQFPNGGWLDSGGAENGDKCAWITPGTPGGAADITLGGGSFAVQTLYSNSYNSNQGGCVISYVSATNQQL